MELKNFNFYIYLENDKLTKTNNYKNYVLNLKNLPS